MDRIRSFDRTVHQLCNKIDILEEEVEYWKDKYEELLKEMNENSKQRLIESQKGVASALLFALSVRDDDNGNLFISSDDRRELANNWKS